MGLLLVVTGPPGAGKSTVTRILADRFEPSVLVEGDVFFSFLARGAIEPWLAGTDEQNEIDERHVLRDPPDQPEHVANLIVAALTSDRLAYRYPSS